MKNNRSAEIKVGIVTIIGIALLIIGISMGKSINVNTGEPQITFIFPNSGGIQQSAPVTVNGVERGKVTSIKNKNGKVEIIAKIDDTSDFHSDATAQILILEITGGKKIQINPGEEGKFDIEKPILGTTPPDIAELVAILGDVSDDAVNLVRRLDTALIAINLLLNDETFVDDVKKTASNASELTGNLNSLIDDNYADLELAIDNIRHLSSELKNIVDHNSPKLNKIIDDLDKTLASADKLLLNADTAVKDFRAIADDLNDITGAVKNKGGLVNKLIYDKDFSNKLDSTFARLSELLNMIHEHGVNVNVRIGTRP